MKINGFLNFAAEDRRQLHIISSTICHPFQINWGQININF